MPDELQLPDDMIPEHLRGLSLEQLGEKLKQHLTLSVENIREAAWCVRAIEALGGDLSYIPRGTLDILHRVAYSRSELLSELAMKLFGQPARFRVLSRLMPPDLKKIVDGGGVEVVVRNNGAFDKRVFQPEDMTTDQFNRAFGDDRIRSEQEQIALLESEATTKVEKAAAIVGLCPHCKQPLPKRRKR